MRMTTGIMHNERHKGIRYVLVYVWRVKGGETDEDKSENPRNQNGPKKKKPKRKGREGTPRKPRVYFYDHQPSSSIVGVVDTTLPVGDAERISAPLGFGVLNPLPFGVRWGTPFAR